MLKAHIIPGKLTGKVDLPSSKSQTIRSLLFALMAKGKSRIENPLFSPDTSAMTTAIQHLGAKVEIFPDAIEVEGVGGKLAAAEDIIQCGNSGQVLRFIGALCALSPSYTALTGDLSIRHLRPVHPLLDGLNQLGVFAASTRLDGYAPIIIKGPVKGKRAKIEGEDSQPVSGLLMLGAFTPLELEVFRPGEKPWIALTLKWFDYFGISYENHDFRHFKIAGDASLTGFSYRVPADFSSAAFPLALGLITGSEVSLSGIDFKDAQGDKAILQTLQAMGAKFAVKDREIFIEKEQTLRGASLDINDYIDALPILAVLGCFASSKLEIKNATIARRKESDRIASIVKELKKMGATIEEHPDGLTIHPSKLVGSPCLETHNDHRIAMALTIAAMGAKGESTISHVDCAKKSYPRFFDDLSRIGAKITLS